MIPFLKMHGLGNDFVVFDNRAGGLPQLNWAKVADRHFGVGCDQVVVLESPSKTLPLKGEGGVKADVHMRIFNSDGGEVASCGNASRAVALLICGERKGLRSHKSVTIETLAGPIEAHVTDRNAITIDMGTPRRAWRDIPLQRKEDTLHLAIASGPLQDPAAVSMGNPHMVFFVPDIGAVNLAELGPELEHHPLFPERANVGVAHVESRERLALRVWERGAGLTLACGTGACAAVVAAHLRGLTGRKVQVRLPGGELRIEWRTDDDHVLMTGPAELSFKGEIDAAGYRA